MADFENHPFSATVGTEVPGVNPDKRSCHDIRAGSREIVPSPTLPLAENQPKMDRWHVFAGQSGGVQAAPARSGRTCRRKR